MSREKAIAALEVFAEAANRLENDGFDCYLDNARLQSSAGITLGDLRRAREALASLREGAGVAEGPWRIGNHYQIHVYDGERPVATFLTPGDAARAVAAVNASPPPQEAPLPGGLGCLDCGLSYSDTGFQDFVVSDETWRQLCPEDDGLLCVTCMTRRAAKKGIEAEGAFTSGPFADHDWRKPAASARRTREALIGDTPPAEEAEACPRCHGRGTVRELPSEDFGPTALGCFGPCPSCGGTGRYDDMEKEEVGEYPTVECEQCKGTGRVQSESTGGRASMTMLTREEVAELVAKAEGGPSVFGSPEQLWAFANELSGDISRLAATALSAMDERDKLIRSTGEHITVRSDYLARAEKAEAERDVLRKLADMRGEQGGRIIHDVQEALQVVTAERDAALAAVEDMREAYNAFHSRLAR